MADPAPGSLNRDALRSMGCFGMMIVAVEMRVLTDDALSAAVAELAERDRDLAAIVARFGPPPLWARETGFGTLVQIILEQQVSLASARVAYERLAAAAGGMTPEQVEHLDDAAMRAAGVSRQKASYIRALASAIVGGRFDPLALDAMDDDTARATLLGLKGIGAWSADIYLLMALLRADVWPSGDLALVGALREVKRLRTVPSQRRIDQLTRPWRPWRAVAARVLWHHYLSTPRVRRAVSVAKKRPERPRIGRPAPTPRRAPKGQRSEPRS
jgi:DNA-3-methyladenine glycosylase II